MLPRSSEARNMRVRSDRCVMQPHRKVSGAVAECGRREEKRRTTRMVGGGKRAESTCLRKSRRILEKKGVGGPWGRDRLASFNCQRTQFPPLYPTLPADPTLA